MQHWAIPLYRRRRASPVCVTCIFSLWDANDLFWSSLSKHRRDGARGLSVEHQGTIGCWNHLPMNCCLPFCSETQRLYKPLVYCLSGDPELWGGFWNRVEGFLGSKEGSESSDVRMLLVGHGECSLMTGGNMCAKDILRETQSSLSSSALYRPRPLVWRVDLLLFSVHQSLQSLLSLIKTSIALLAIQAPLQSLFVTSILLWNS